MRLLVIFLAMATVSAFAACGGSSSSSESTSAPAVADNCSSDDATSLKASVQPLMTRFEDANTLANSTSRIALSGVITEMQSTRRDFDALDVPACASLAKTQMLDFMNDTIDSYLSFMAQDSDAVVQSKISAAQTAQTQAKTSWAVIFGDQTPEITPQVTAAPSAAPSATPVDAARLITALEVGSALGGTWGKGILGVGGCHSLTCDFFDDNTAILANEVSLNVDMLGDNPEQDFHDRTAGAFLTTSYDHGVSGVGDGAYWSRNNGLSVRKGNIDITVLVTWGGVFDESKSLSIAQIVLNNLGK